MSAPDDPRADRGSNRTPLNVVSVQIEAQFKNVQRNGERIKELLRNTPSDGDSRDDLDLIVLSEMVLTGYMFTDRTEVEPFMEKPFGDDVTPLDVSSREISSSSSSAACPTLNLCLELARQYSCYAIAGVPARTPLRLPASQQSQSISESFDARPSPHERKVSGLPPPEQADEQGWYNAALLVGPQGLLHVFRKHFLYEAEEGWASEGPGFTSITLPHLRDPHTSFKLGCGICMDLSPHTFTSPFDNYEFSSWAAREKCDVVACPMAWLAIDQKRVSTEVVEAEVEATQQGEATARAREESDEESVTSLNPDEPDPRMLNYWALRLTPLIRQQHQTTVILCNRIGYERGTTFGGSSCILRLGHNEASLVAAAGAATEEAIHALIPIL